VCRYIAVTQPIRYAKHKNSRRTYVMLALTWFTSVLVSLPIAVGINYTDRRAETPNLCTFYNAEFLIYSSMMSFYIPSVVIVLLYWRIFRAIHSRTQRRHAATAPTLHRQLPDIYVVDKHHVNDITTHGTAERREDEVEGSVEACDGGVVTVAETEMDTAGITECVSSAAQDSSTSNDAVNADVTRTTQNDRRATTQNKTATRKTGTLSSDVANERRLRLSRLSRHATRSTTRDKNTPCSRDKNASRRERKATKTLAIVLGTLILSVYCQ